MSTAAKRRKAQKIRRRVEILDAAETVFRDKGPVAATMDEVAVAADVSKGTLYLYFESKDDLFGALTHRPLDAVLARFAELIEEDVDGLTLISRLIEVHHEVLHAHAQQMRVAIARLCGGIEPEPDTPSSRDYSQRISSLRAIYVGAIERGIRDGSLRPDLDPHDVAAGLWASGFGASFIRMHASCFEARLDGQCHPMSLDRIHQSVSKLLLSGIANPERASR